MTGGLINFLAGGLGTGTITVNGGGLQWAAGNTSDISAQLAAIGSGGATFDTNGNNVSFATTLTGSGGLTKAGSGTLTLAGASYTGATNVNGGTLQAGAANVFASSSAVTVASGATLAFNGFNQTLASLAGAGAVTMGAATLTAAATTPARPFPARSAARAASTKIGTGVADPHRRQHLHRRHHRQWRRLVVNGSLASARHGQQRRRAERHRPLRRAGDQWRHPRPRQLDRYAERQRQLHPERRHLSGRGQRRWPERSHQRRRQATLNGGTVQVLAETGTYARNTTYTILNATRRPERRLFECDQQLRVS